MIRVVISLTLLLAGPVVCWSEEGVFVFRMQFEDEGHCVSPLMESQLWAYFEGTVVSAVGYDSVRIRLTGSGLTEDIVTEVVVRLSGISAKAEGPRFKTFIEQQAVGRKATVLADPQIWSEDRPKPRELTGMVNLKPPGDLGLMLIHARVARFAEQTSYPMGAYMRCRYQLADAALANSRR